jgi:hypothetical protein
MGEEHSVSFEEDSDKAFAALKGIGFEERHSQPSTPPKFARPHQHGGVRGKVMVFISDALRGGPMMALLCAGMEARHSEKPGAGHS